MSAEALTTVINETQPPHPAPVRSGWSVALARGAIVSVAVVLAWWTWGHWGDIQIDCGRELYVPLEVLRGKLVYRDFWYPYGPLMPYVEALLIATFGKHLAVYYIFGLSVTIASALLLFEIGMILDGIAVGLTAAFGLILEGFEPWAFNFIFPYSYAATLGLALGLLSAILAVKYVINDSRISLALGGVAAALALLCKQEVGLASFVMLGWIVGAGAVCKRSVPRLFDGALLCLPGAAIATAVYGYLFWKLTPGFVLENWIGPPGPYFAEKYGKTLYAGFGMRFAPFETAGLIVSGALALRLWYWLARLSLRSKNARVWLIAIVAIPLVVRVATSGSPWSHSVLWHLVAVVWEIIVYPRGMYFVALGYLIYLGVQLYKTRDAGLLLAKTAVSVFAVALAVRVLAQVTPLGYSIYYATPLFLIFALALSATVRLASTEHPERAGFVTNRLLAVEVLILAILIVPFGGWRNTRLETDWGAIYLSRNDADTAKALLGLIGQAKQSGKRVVIVPELPILYALTDTEAVGRWYTLLPGFLSAAEEADYVRALSRARPDIMIVTARSYEEYGAPRFGVDFVRQVAKWIEGNYRFVERIGEPPQGSSQSLSARIYQRL